MSRRKRHKDTCRDAYVSLDSDPKIENEPLGSEDSDNDDCPLSYYEDALTKSKSEKMPNDVQWTNFDLCDPNDDTDHNGVAFLLESCSSHLLEMFNLNLTEFVDVILNQPNIGSVIKNLESEAEEEQVDTSTPNSDDACLLGLVTILNIAQYPLLCNIKSKLRIMIGSASTNEDTSTVYKILDNAELQIGWLLNECILNMPLELCVDTHLSLLDDVKWSLESNEDDCPESEKMFYRYDYLFAVSKCHRTKSQAIKIKKTKTKNDEDEAMIHETPSGQTYKELSVWKGYVSLNREFLTTPELNASTRGKSGSNKSNKASSAHDHYAMVCLIKADALPNIVKSMRRLLPT